MDGVSDLSPQSRDPFNLEQVDVVKGPGSVYTGRGSTGGSINLLNKTPGLRRSFGGTLDFGTDRTRRATADINIPIGDSRRFRLNLLAHHSGVAGRDVVKFDRWGVAPSLTFGLGKPTRVTVSYYKLKQNNISDYGIPWVPVTNNALVEFRDRPAPVPRNTFYGLARSRLRKVELRSRHTEVRTRLQRRLITAKSTSFRQLVARLDCHAAAFCKQQLNRDQSRAAFVANRRQSLGQPDRFRCTLFNRQDRACTGHRSRLHA